MKKLLHYLPLMFFTLAVISFTVQLTKPAPEKTNNAKIMRGMKMPEFTLPLLDGTGDLGSADWKGRTVALNFFASWCVPCAAEMPLLVETMQKHKVELYGIAWHDKPERTKEFLVKYGNPYTATLTDRQGKLTAELGLLGIPETYVIGPDGALLFKYTGALDKHAIEGTIIPLLEGTLNAQ